MRNQLGKRALAGILVGLLLWLVSALWIPLALGAILAVIAQPAAEWLQARKIKRSLAAFVVTWAVLLLFVAPVAFLLLIGAKAGVAQLKSIPATASGAGTLEQQIVTMPWVQSAIEKVTSYFPISGADLINTVEDLARSGALWVADTLGAFIGQIPGMTFGLVLILVSLYFYLVDGQRVVTLVRRHSWFGPAGTERILGVAAGLSRSVVLASLVSGLGQTLVFTLGMIVTGRSNVPLIALLIFLCSFLPLIGASPITFGVAIHQLLLGHTGVAITLVIFAIVTALIDNVIRPWVLKGGGNLHPLLAFVAAFGGLQTLGFAGVFLGPILAGLALVVMQVAVEEDQ